MRSLRGEHRARRSPSFGRSCRYVCLRRVPHDSVRQAHRRRAKPLCPQAQGRPPRPTAKGGILTRMLTHTTG